jgi:hypothetical protein
VSLSFASWNRLEQWFRLLQTLKTPHDLLSLLRSSLSAAPELAPPE